MTAVTVIGDIMAESAIATGSENMDDEIESAIAIEGRIGIGIVIVITIEMRVTAGEGYAYVGWRARRGILHVMVTVRSGRAVCGTSRGTVVVSGRRTRGAIVNVSRGQVGMTEAHEVLNIEEGMRE